MNDRISADAQTAITPLQALAALNRAYPEPQLQAALPLEGEGLALESTAPLGAGIPDIMHGVVQSLTTAFDKLAESLSDFAKNLSNLDVETFAVPDFQQLLNEKDVADYLKKKGQLVAWTQIGLDGDLMAAVPEQGGRLNENLWAAHKDLVDLAQANRAAMIKAAVDALVTLITPTKVG